MDLLGEGVEGEVAVMAMQGVLEDLFSTLIRAALVEDGEKAKNSLEKKFE